jgi:aconitate hydratase
MQFVADQNRESLALTGCEEYFIDRVATAISSRGRAQVRAVAPDGTETRFEVLVRIDTPVEADYYRNGGILPYVLRQLVSSQAATSVR